LLFIDFGLFGYSPSVFSAAFLSQYIFLKFFIGGVFGFVFAECGGCAVLGFVCGGW